jgi:hypothetical protein
MKGVTMSNDRISIEDSGLCLKKVTSKISLLILSFCNNNLRSQKGTFTMTELDNYVVENTKATPGSAGRVLRYLKSIGKVQYKIINRAKSLYSIWTVSGN